MRPVPARSVPRLLRGALLGGVLLAAACTEVAKPPVEPAAPAAPSAESQQLARYYAAVQARLESEGLMRTDGGGPDTPFSAAKLAEDFERIALYDEYVVRNGRFIAQQTPSFLRRWEVPIRYAVIHGPSSGEDVVAEDTANVESYARRLSRLTGVSIAPAKGRANMILLFLNRDEQRTIGPRLMELMPGLGKEVIDEIVNSPRNTFCAAYALANQDRPQSYSAAIILIKGEHRKLGRLSCIHEEMAQSMGLANDSPTARPSIFNDDEEFALLTYHDELLLRILYDPRLKPGMTPDQARPIVRRIANELIGSS